MLKWNKNGVLVVREIIMISKINERSQSIEHDQIIRRMYFFFQIKFNSKKISLEISKRVKYY